MSKAEPHSMYNADDVLSVVRETRKIVLPQYGVAEVKAKKTALPHDVVTQLDQDVERFLTEKLRVIDPESGFSGEEFGDHSSGDTFWLCDPIDGTAHFIRGMPFCTTMLARIEAGAVVFSVVYDFVNDELYHAEKGRGAFRNGAPIQVSNRSLSDAYVSYETHLEKEENLRTFAKIRNLTGIVKFMNCGHEFAMIASGKLEGRLCFDPWGHDWDYAPGSLLVSEAGGVVANLGTRGYDYRNHDFLAANPLVFKQLTQGSDAVFPITE